MKTTISLILTCIYLCLALLHVYWAFGGHWGIDNALPSDISGRKVLNPGMVITLIVAFGLFVFATFYTVQSGYLSIYIPRFIQLVLKWCIPSVFLLRSIGDFKYVGFFKAVKGTEFAHLDTFFYSPLCFFLAIVGYFIASKID